MNKTGKIKFYTPLGKGKPFKDNDTGEERILDQYKVGFADGNEYKFSAKGDWKHEVGTEISYIVSNEQYKFAKGATKIIQEQVSEVLKPNEPFARPETIRMRATTNDSIILQVCYKENMQAFAKENRGEVIKNTKQDFKDLKEILNNL